MNELWTNETTTPIEDPYDMVFSKPITNFHYRARPSLLPRLPENTIEDDYDHDSDFVALDNTHEATTATVLEELTPITDESSSDSEGDVGVDPEYDLLCETRPQLLKTNITTTFYGQNVKLTALLDSGASHSIISRQLLRDLGVKTRTYNRNISLRLANGSVQQVRRVRTYEPIELCFMGSSFKVTRHFLVVPDLIHEVDLILGVDFMREHCVNIDWYHNSLLMYPKHSTAGDPVEVPLLTQAVYEPTSAAMPVFHSKRHLRSQLRRGAVIYQVSALPPSDESQQTTITIASATMDSAPDEPTPMDTTPDHPEGTKLVDGIYYGDHLTDAQIEDVQQLIAKYPNVLVDKLPLRQQHNQLPRELYHDIQLRDVNVELPTQEKYLRLPPHMLTKLRKFVQDLVDQGVLVPADPLGYASKCFLVRKKPGSSKFRMVTDFRDVNALLKVAAAPSCDMRELLDTVANAKVRSTFDLSDAYHQLSLTERSRQFVRIRVGREAFAYTVAPMGLLGSAQALAAV